MNRKWLKKWLCYNYQILGQGLPVRMSTTRDNMHSTIKSGDRILATYLPEPTTTVRDGYLPNIKQRLDKDDGMICIRLYNAGEQQYD